jgi:Fe2+ transport system protein FeoA
VLLAAIVVLPLGVGCAPASKYEAVSARLDAAVAAGELTDDQAAEMKVTLERVTIAERMGATDEMGIGERLKVVGEGIKKAAEAGEMTEKEAWASWFAFKEGDIAPRLKAAVKAGEMTEREAWGIWHAIGMAEIGERLRAAVAKGELTGKEAWAKWAKIAGRRRHRGKHGRRDECGRKDMHRRIAGVLMERGVPREKLRDVLGVMRRIIGEMKAKGEAFELDPAVRAKLTEMGLTDEQVKLMVGLSKRMAIVDHARVRRERKPDPWRRAAAHLAENGVPREKLRDVLGVMKRIIEEMKAKGEAFELDPAVRAKLTEMGLTDEQVKLVVGLSRRLSMVGRERTKCKPGARGKEPGRD